MAARMACSHPVHPSDGVPAHHPCELLDERHERVRRTRVAAAIRPASSDSTCAHAVMRSPAGAGMIPSRGLGPRQGEPVLAPRGVAVVAD